MHPFPGRPLRALDPGGGAIGALGEGALPDWLPALAPEALARGPDGRPARVPEGPVFSLLHTDFLRAVGAWYAALGAALGPLAGAPVVAWHLDGGAGRTFAGRFGQLDFNPDTVGRYRRFLVERHETARALSRGWGRAIPAFDAVLPPRDRRSPGELGDWQAFLETWVADYLGRLGELARAGGAGVPLAAGTAATGASPEAPALTAPRLTFFGVSLRPGAGPFGASQAALRADPFAAEDRPQTAWALSGVRDVLGAVAHGVKGYSLRADGEVVAEAEPLQRLQHWLAGAEEELTASVELRDPIAYLDYPPYARFTPDDLRPPGGAPLAERFGLLALLLTCGYNPAVVNLEAIADAELTEFPLAIFPSRGYLRLDDYGKLVVFTLRGGALVTFPEPATRELDGMPINTRFLWPHRPARRSLPGTLLGLFRAGLRPGLRDALGGESLPSEGAVRIFPEAGRPFTRYGRAGVGAVPRAATEAVRAQVLLTAGGLPAGYRVQVRSGTSTVLGAPLAARYATPGYGALPARARLALRRFALRLFEEVAPRQMVPDDGLEVEAVARLSPDGGCLLFVLNHLGAQSGWLRFPAPGSLNLGDDVRADVLFSVAGSRAAGGPGGVRLDLAAGDALVVRLT